MDSSDLATSIFGPLPSEALTLNLPQPDDERTLQEWCSSELVSLPSTALPASDGAVLPLDQREQEELSDHPRSGHSSKSNLCRGCLQAEGPRKVHRTVRHIDIAGPFTTSDDGFSDFLVGALRLPGFPLLIDVRLLSSRGSVEVCVALERMVAFFESLYADSLRVKRLHSDRAGEFTAPYFERFLTNHKSVYHTFTSGYDPQANGTAERAVGLVKSVAARALATAQLDSSYWSYSVGSVAQSLPLPFGSSVVAQELDHKKIKFPDLRTVTGRLLFWDHMQHQVSYILCPPGEEDSIDSLVYRARIPAKLPPAINIDELTGPDPLPPLASRPTIFDRPMQDRMVEEETTRNPLDLDPLPVDRPLYNHDSGDDRSKENSTHPTLPDDDRRDKDGFNNDNLNDEDDDDVIVEYSLADAHSSLFADCPFSFLYLSSEDSTRDDPSHDTEQDNSLPMLLHKAGNYSHSVAADEVLRSTGDVRRK